MKKLILALLLIPISFFCASQEWYFGYGAGITFNGPTSIFFPGGHTSTNEGCAVANDANGHLLFYTDGTTVWNRLGLPMDDDLTPTGHITQGNGLDGNSSATQAAIIVPKPKSCAGCTCDTFYIFTVASGQGGMYGNPPAGGYSSTLFGFGMKYSMVVFDAAHFLGFVPHLRKNVPLTTCVSEKLTAIYDAPNNRYWILAHGYDPHDNTISITANRARQFICYQVTAAGVVAGPPNILPGSSPQEDPFLGAQNKGDNAPGQMKFSPDGKLVALGVYYAKFIEVYDFNMTNGQLSNARRINFPSGEGKIYGLEFSPDSKQLFVSQNIAVPSSFIYQINLAGLLAANPFIPVANVPTYTVTSTSPFFYKFQLPPPTSVLEYGAMQLGPDGNIYVGRNPNTYVSKIITPTNFPAQFINVGVQLTGVTQGAWSLPNIVVNALRSTCHVDSPKVCPTCTAITNSVKLAMDNNTTFSNYNAQGIHLNFTSVAALQQIRVNVAYLSFNWNGTCQSSNTSAISQGCLFPATANQMAGSLILNNPFGMMPPPWVNLNECASQLQWGLGTFLQPGSYSIPMNLSLPLGATSSCLPVINRLCLRVTFKDANCNICDTLIWLDTSCCSGGQWTMAQVIHAGLTNTKSLPGLLQCNNQSSPMQVSCHQSYQLQAHYSCRSNCPRPVITYTINGPVNSSGSLPAIFTPAVSGTYSITYYAWCGGVICDSCTLWVETDCPIGD